MARIPIVKWELDKTIKAKREYTLLSKKGKGTINMISFVCNGDQISLHIKVDEKKKIDYPNTNFFFNLNITHPNNIVYCHIYDKTVVPEQYGLLSLQKIEFEKSIRIYLLNEEDTDRTIARYLVTGEIEV